MSAEQSRRITEVLAPYGIVATEDFWRRYQTDALIHALVNIVVGQDEATKEAVKMALKRGVEEGARRAVDQIERKLAEAALKPHHWEGS